ncbi:MAG: hypothetical protein K2N67_04350 [Mucispirillum sp.]|nr:hypothetical protein [Mucispirillum sp.]
MNYYIASCVFSERHPKLSEKIIEYVSARHNIPIVRCCTPKYKLKEFENKMEEPVKERWIGLPDTAKWQEGDIAYSICHNCCNIAEEYYKGVKALSLWELILSDKDFKYPDYSGMEAFIQDCWRSKERHSEQLAVRALLEKMNIKYDEIQENFGKANFCGNSLYRPQPSRNPALAPKYYKDGAVGLFEPHTYEEQIAVMKDYCRRFDNKDVICYCHYCLEGLETGRAEGFHIAQLLFP